MKKNNKDIKIERELNERFDATENFSMQLHADKKIKINTLLGSFLILCTDLSIIFATMAIAVTLATKIALMKVTYILVTATWYKPFILQEYSLTLGMLSILLFCMLYLFIGPFYSKLRTSLYERINRPSNKLMAKYDEKTKNYNQIEVK